MIKLNNISKYYPAGFGKTYVLRNINMEIKEVEFVSIIGPSDSGKSTLLHILGLLEEASEGEYLFMDSPVQKLNEKDGVTIIQVTHSEKNAEYGNRIVRLKDGWVD